MFFLPLGITHFLTSYNTLQTRGECFLRAGYLWTSVNVRQFCLLFEVCYKLGNKNMMSWRKGADRWPEKCHTPHQSLLVVSSVSYITRPSLASSTAGVKSGIRVTLCEAIEKETIMEIQIIYKISRFLEYNFLCVINQEAYHYFLSCLQN